MNLDSNRAVVEDKGRSGSPTAADRTPGSPHSDLLVVAKGAGISFFGSWAGQGATFLSGVVVARALGAEQYGLYTLAVMVVTTLSAISAIGLPVAAQRYIAIFRGEGDAARTKGTLLASLAIAGLISSFMGAALFASSSFLGGTVFSKPELTPLFQLLAVAVPLLCLTTVAVYCTYAFRTTKYGVLVQNVLNPWVKLAAAVVLISLGWRLGGVLAAYLLALAAGCGLALYYLNRLFPLAGAGAKAVYQPRGLLSFGLPVFGAGVVGLLQGQADVYLLGFLSSGQDVGVYRAASMLAMLVPGALLSLNSIFAPMISDLYHQGRLAELERLFQSITRWSLAASLPMSLAFLLHGGPVLSVFGPAFAAGTLSLAVLSVGQLVNAATGPVGFMISMTGRPQVNLANGLAMLVITVGLGLLLVPRLGPVGAAAAAGVGLALVNLIRVWEVRFFLQMSPGGKGIWKPPTAALAAGAASYAISSYWLSGVGLGMLAVNLLLLLGAYALALWLLGIDGEDREVAQALKRRLGAALTFS